MRRFHDVRDLALFYQAFLKEKGLDRVTVIGTGFGGWIAAEVAAMSTDRLAALVLIGAVGLKFSDRDERDIADLYATPLAAFVGPGVRRSGQEAEPLRDHERVGAVGVGANP